MTYEKSVKGKFNSNWKICTRIHKFCYMIFFNDNIGHKFFDCLEFSFGMLDFQNQIDFFTWEISYKFRYTLK